jgi:putative phosphoesterase
MRVGVISDTHGRLRPAVFRHFESVEHILHAGDIGGRDILDELGAIAPVHAVFGNTDGMETRGIVEAVVEIDLAGHAIVVMHGHQLGSPTPAGLARAFPRAGIVVFGHTHRPLEERIGGQLFINPGGAGAPRFGLTPSIGILELSSGGGAAFEVIQLED